VPDHAALPISLNYDGPRSWWAARQPDRSRRVHQGQPRCATAGCLGYAKGRHQHRLGRAKESLYLGAFDPGSVGWSTSLPPRRAGGSYRRSARARLERNGFDWRLVCSCV